MEPYPTPCRGRLAGYRDSVASHSAGGPAIRLPPQVHRGGQGVTIFEWVLYSPGDLDWDARAYIVVRTNGRWGPITRVGPIGGCDRARQTRGRLGRDRHRHLAALHLPCVRRQLRREGPTQPTFGAAQLRSARLCYSSTSSG